MLLMADREAQDLAVDRAERVLLRLAAVLWDVAKAQANNRPAKGAANPLIMEATSDGR
jgi:hypothetical protein